ncbi:VPS10 domain-containing protein [Carboxylicivirga sp. N1Y90]|uniref:VPS10 domain-containing protein n=1 Tax=Carboxylicivirga fragile TaxID=3417571 RepID=UPI003D3369E6
MIIIIIGVHSVHAQHSLLNDTTFSGLKLRNIGPAFMSGRIADIAIHPLHENTWYVAVGSGGVWKTNNAGTTWKPIFDKQKVYSIGCITIDPNNPHTIWVGSGENVGGRHVSYGDGIYRSNDDGQTWENMGLKESQHISKIIVNPENSDIIWAAVQGPLWNKGGERGLYKSSNGGQTWYKTLGDDEWIGVTDLLIDPRNPKQLYAATWQRHRNVAAYMGGGSGTAIYSSKDGGESWQKLKKGLPNSNMGKIGLAISPQNPDVIYAAIELDRRQGGVYRSTNKGQSWSKMSNAVSGATGPHYYQELYASPHQFDKLYLMDVRIQESNDGGRTFSRMKEQYKHSDNHAIAFKKDDPNYLLIGTDGGLYETFDGTKNWRFISNLPVTQFYKLAVDDAEPFYNIYGGTQDNNTQGGPSRTDNANGIANRDWYVTLFADGHQPATEPGNPNILYSEWQEGNLVRIDKTTGEIVHIQPQPGKGEPNERYNWDAPILVSPHEPTRLYFASQRVWRSDNRGDSWTPISEDLTLNQDRITLPIMGETQSWDNGWDFYAMSNYNTITSLAESPIQEGLIYAGTDDGRIQVTSNGGESWIETELSSISGIPATAFVNDIKADLFEPNTVYAVLDNHKYGDLNPYLIKSTDKGKSWKSIKGNLPENTLVWRLVQDHEKQDLLFAGTEFGIYFTVDGGEKWIKLMGNVPTISFRDLAIQRRENDLVGASFGRSFFVFDDYSVLRHVSEEQLNKEASLFPTRKALRYIPRPGVSMGGRGSQGAEYYLAPNPEFGAIFTYYLKEGYLSIKGQRQKVERELKKDLKPISFPGWESIEKELNQDSIRVWLTVKDSNGDIIRKIKGSTKKGFHRVAWDLRYPEKNAVKLNSKSSGRSGALAPPGVYTASLSKEEDGNIVSLSEAINFEVVNMKDGYLPAQDDQTIANFNKHFGELQNKLSAVNLSLNKSLSQLSAMHKSLAQSSLEAGQAEGEIQELREKLYVLKAKIEGDKAKNEVGEKSMPSINQRYGNASMALRNTYGPTATQLQSLEIATEELEKVKSTLLELQKNQMSELYKLLVDSGAPLIEGMQLP